MTGGAAGTFGLWTHALAAMLFGVLALAVWRERAAPGLPRLCFAIALGATALWALAVAGIGARDLAARVAEGARNLAWLGFMYALARQRASGAERRAVAGVHAVLALIVLLVVGLAVAQPQLNDRAAVAAIAAARNALAMLVAATALVLLRRREPAAGGARLAALALAVLWTADLALYAAAYLGHVFPYALSDARGAVIVLLAPMFALATQRAGDWTLSVSRTVAYQALSVLLIALYLLVAGTASGFIAELSGPHARLAQTAFVFGTAAALLTLVSTPWLRAWAKVVVAKHLFDHRYDYRAEWMRFTDTLGAPGAGAAPLGQRVVKAVADLTASPAGLLLPRAGDVLEPGPAWNWAAGAECDGALVRHLEASRRIVELDAVRAGTAPAEEIAAVPAWLAARADAWAIVPLIHLETLAGAIVVARPPIDRALDWEDFDLLGVAGRQVASYLAEERAHEALAEARRFDEFNRRFAFIMHDLKNLVSQLALVARNAERHADNPAFRADMVATLQECSARMNALLARLSQHHAGRGEPPRAVALRALAEQVAAARRAQHPVEVRGLDVLALADPAALETILNHLVQNAVEASAPDAPVVLEVGEAGGQAFVAVVDRGAGMAPAFVREALFRPFASSKPGGFGLGAFEARQLAEAIGGAVTVESREGEGTRFCVSLRPAPALENAA